MKDKLKVILTIIIICNLFIFYSCGTKESEPAPATQEAFRKVLVENEKVVKLILEDSEKIPDTKSLIDSMVSAQSIVVEDGLKRALEEEIRILQDASKLDKEGFYGSFSRYTEHMTASMKTGGIKLSEYNRFYCPMVKKYWIAKGTEVENPFAPEMRDCGEVSN